MKGKKIDRTGIKINRLTFIKRIKGSIWEVECECGATKQVQAGQVVLQRVKSCGCLNRELSAARCTIHGKNVSPTWQSYRAMKNRCLNPKHNSYHNYGGRGIKICDRWLGDDGFKNFLEDMGERPIDMTLDRIGYEGNYEPSNCRWADQETQNLNKRDSHGQWGTAAYRSWASMKRKSEYSDEFSDFIGFLSFLGEKPNGSRLKRKDSDSPHSPSNSYWG